MKKTILLFFGFLPYLLCAQQFTTEEYIEEYKSIAIREMHHYGIPASITLAQGILESSNGNSPLAIKANNHFGIKCTSEWNGKTYNQDDDRENECFRKYKHAEDSYVDHSEFLRSRPHYSSLFELDRTDYKGWAYGLKKAGYATNPKYPQLLINLIEKYQLHELDKKGKPLASRQPSLMDELDENNHVKYVTASGSQSLSQVAEKYDIPARRLLKYNDLPKRASVQKGDRIYVQPKRNRGSEKYHIMEKGETMYSISQEEGIKLKKLYKRNLMQAGMEPAVGERLRLRGKRDKTPALADYPPRTKPEKDNSNSTRLKYKYHTVQKGDTLYAVSKRYGLSVQELKKMNSMASDALEIGQKLIVGY